MKTKLKIRNRIFELKEDNRKLKSAETLSQRLINAFKVSRNKEAIKELKNLLKK